MLDPLVRWRLAGAFLKHSPEIRGHDRIAEMLRGKRVPSGILSGDFGPGLTFRMEITEDISLHDLFFAQYRRPSMAPILDAMLHPGDCFYDVGANIGIYSLWAARLVGPEGQVHSFEPQRQARKHLKELVTQNRLQNVVVYTEAVGFVGEVATLGSFSGNSGIASIHRWQDRDDATQTKVPLIRLDAVATRTAPPTLVKVDVEGFECEVIRGMSSVISRNRPPILLEVSDPLLKAAGDSADKLLKLLLSHGYSAWNLMPRGLEKISSRVESTNILATDPDRHLDLVRKLDGVRFPKNQNC